MSHVSVVKGDDRYGNIKKALHLIVDDFKKAQLKGKSVLVKVNLVSDSVELSTVHVDAVKAVIDFIQPFEPGKIIIAECSAKGYNTWKAFERFGYKALEKEYGNVELLNIGEDNFDIINFATLDGHGKMVKISRTAKNCDYKLSVARAKTHDHVICTGSMKNMLGCILVPDQVWLHGDKVEHEEPLEIARKSNWIACKNIVKLMEIIKPDVSVIDGFVGMEGDGPVDGSPVDLRTAIASTDCVAADAVMAKIMGFSPLEISYIYLCNRKGIGKGDLKDIKIIGDSPEKVKIEFTPHSNYKSTQIYWKKYAELEDFF